MRLQRTLKTEVAARGVGLHSGKICSVRLRPARRDAGIIFVRRGVEISAKVANVYDTAFSTNLAHMGVRVRTVEHLLASLAALGVDNAFIDLTGPEVPILDGSAEGYVNLILKAGVAQQRKECTTMRIKKPVIYAEGRSYVMAVPYAGYRVSHRISFDNRFLEDQQFELEITERSFIEQIALARTFGFLKDVEALRKRGLALGGNLDNAVVISGNRILNGSGLRYRDEFVRHKILDAVGDLSLLGYPLEARIIACRSGHSMNVKFMKHLLRSRDCWEPHRSETQYVSPPMWQPREIVATSPA